MGMGDEPGKFNLNTTVKVSYELWFTELITFMGG